VVAIPVDLALEVVMEADRVTVLKNTMGIVTFD